MRQRVLAAFYNKDETALPAIARDEERKWQLELNPQRLKIQTIDSFIHGVVHRMPYLSQLSLEFQPVEDADSLYQEAVKAMLQHIVTDPDELGPAISRALSTLDNKYSIGLELIAQMLSSRQHWIEVITLLGGKSMVPHRRSPIVSKVHERLTSNRGWKLCKGRSMNSNGSQSSRAVSLQLSN